MKSLIKLIEEAGDFIIGDDGFVIFWPSDRGAFTAHNLREIADELDKRNKEWEEQLQAYFSSHKED